MCSDRLLPLGGAVDVSDILLRSCLLFCLVSDKTGHITWSCVLRLYELTLSGKEKKRKSDVSAMMFHLQP